MPPINLSIDCVIFGFDNDQKLKVLLIKKILIKKMIINTLCLETY